jgi:hypothetical protein
MAPTAAAAAAMAKLFQFIASSSFAQRHSASDIRRIVRKT